MPLGGLLPYGQRPRDEISYGSMGMNSQPFYTATGAPVGGGTHTIMPVQPPSNVSGGFMGLHPDSPLAQQGSGLLRDFQANIPQPMNNAMGGLMDFNAQAQALAGPMPELPSFDFSPITINSGGSAPPSNSQPPGGNTGGSSYVGQPTMGDQPYNAPPGTAGSGTPGAIADLGDLGNQLDQVYGGGNPPQNFDLTTDAPTVTGPADPEDVMQGLLMGGPLGAGLSYFMGGEETPVEPSTIGPGIVNMWGDMPSSFSGGQFGETGFNAGQMGPTVSDSEVLNLGGLMDMFGAPTSGELTAEEVDLAMPTTGGSVDQGPAPPSVQQLSNISYGGLPGLSPAAVAILNRRFSVPPRSQR